VISRDRILGKMDYCDFLGTCVKLVYFCLLRRIGSFEPYLILPKMTKIDFKCLFFV
jgi:hypothetical protein